MISHQWSHINEFPQEAVKMHMKKFDHTFSSQPLLLYSSLIFEEPCTVTCSTHFYPATLRMKQANEPFNKTEPS